ncbi:unnamed protein product [Adineta steineri]|uniref:G-protein coupled receptors family 1 profile domain-containing protein n=1 Tax=Adineta steineri TaxID=433720 RepID=A0A814WNW9_9BILA|nr:unnamed protein product [Adineta steineri]
MSTLASQLRASLVYVNGYCLIPVFTLGIIGNIANMIVFCQGRLKNNGCSLYFVIVSLIHIFVLCFGCIVRIVITLSGFDLSHFSLFFCKCRVYFFVAGVVLSRFYLCLISIDRWLITSLNARTRRLSNVKTIRRIILVSTIIWLLFHLHVGIGFRIEISGCVPSSDGFYSTFYLITNLAFSIIPFIIIILFTTLTLHRIIMKKRLGNRRNPVVHPVELVERNNHQSNSQNTMNDLDERLSNKNLQLIKLNIIQVIFFILLNLPNTIYTLYSFITKTNQKTNDQITIDNFFNYVASSLLYTHCAISFYIYTLASVTFRKEFWTLCLRIQQNIVTFFRRFL